MSFVLHCNRCCECSQPDARREDHLESVASTFHEVYDNTSAFLLDAGHTELFLSELRKDQDNLRYLISQYNVSALVEIQLILTDSEGKVRFTTFRRER